MKTGEIFLNDFSNLKGITKLVIVAGGKGTRLGLTDIPKPMVEINGKPVLEHQINLAKKYGIKDIYILSGYLANTIFDYFGNGEKFGVKISHLVEPFPLGNGGCLGLIENILKEDEKFIVFYGDVILDIDLENFIKFAGKKESIGTVFAHHNDHPLDSNLLEVDATGKIIAFHLKPHDELKFYETLSIGSIFVLSKKCFKYIPFGKPSDLDKEVLPSMVASGEVIMAYQSSEYAKDIGTPQRLEEVREDFLTGKVARLNRRNKREAIFIDRDGTINKFVDNLSRIEDFELIAGVGEAIKKINQSGYLAVSVTNQPMVAKGFLKEDELWEIHKKMETVLGRENAYLDKIYYCPHHPESGFPGEVKSLKIECDCRKPNVGMVNKAVEELNIDLAQSWMIGDSETDLICGKTAGCKTILLNQNNEKNQYADYVFTDLLSAVNFIFEEKNKPKGIQKIPFGTISITQRAKDLTMEVLNSGRVSQGKFVREFEKKFAEIVGVKEAVAVSSGTEAVTLALAVFYDFGAQRGDEVIMPANSFVATGNAVVNAGFQPIFVDIERETLNINPNKIEETVTAKTKAILPVHLMGKPAEMDKINEIAKKYRLSVVEDAAEAHGAFYKGKSVGGLGDMGAFSLYLAHIISSIEGGIVTTNNSQYAEILRSLRSHGRACKCEKCILNTSSGYCAKRFMYGTDIRFVFERIGYSCKMNEIEAVIGLGNLEIYEEILEKRKNNMKLFTEGLQGFSQYFFTISEENHEKIGPHAFPIILKDGIGFSRDQLVKYLEENGIETRYLFPSIPTQCPGFAYLGYKLGEFPEAEYIGNNGFHIGVHQDIGEKEIEYFFDKLREFVGQDGYFSKK